MKIRQGFVSNSSSSSFVCAVCGADACGYDIGLSDCSMTDCSRGHIFCKKHLLPLEEGQEEKKDEDEVYYEVDPRRCPICQLKTVRSGDAMKYLLKKFGLTAAEVDEEIQKNFKTLDELRKFIR